MKRTLLNSLVNVAWGFIKRRQLQNFMFFTCDQTMSGFHATNWLRQWARNVPFPLPPSPSLSLTLLPSPAQEITAQSTLTTKPKHLRVPKNSCSCECLGVPGWKKRENLDMYRKKNLKPQEATIYHHQNTNSCHWHYFYWPLGRGVKSTIITAPTLAFP